MKHCLLFLPGIIFLFACNKPIRRKNEITKIEIATGGCFGPCQSTVTSVDSGLIYKYYGGGTNFPLPPKTANDGKLEGYYLAKISQGFWDTLNIKFEHINYKRLDSTYQRSIDDQSLEIFIHYGNKVKHIKAQSASLTNDVADVFYYLINSYRFIKPKATKDTFNFESTTQTPFPPPKPPALKN